MSYPAICYTTHFPHFSLLDYYYHFAFFLIDSDEALVTHADVLQHGTGEVGDDCHFGGQGIKQF